MAASNKSKRILIPSLDEIDNENEFDPGSLFKRHKNNVGNSSRDAADSAQSSTGFSSIVQRENEKLSVSSTTGQSSPSKSCEISRNERLLPSSSTVSSSAHLGNDEVHDPSPNDEGFENSKSSISSKPGSSNSLIVNPRQRGNPILKSVRNVPWEYGNIVPDYVMGPSNCALFLSLRYHQLHPNYIHDRLKNLGRSYELRVMLVQVDVKEPHHLLKDLAKICILADCTLILAFSVEEAGRYLETYKVFENKPAEAIMEKTEDNFMAKFVDCLTRVKSVNKTDCATLLTAFGSLSNIMEAKEDELCLCPGFGPQKAKRLHSIFQEPFLRNFSKGHTSNTEEKDFSSEGT